MTLSYDDLRGYRHWFTGLDDLDLASVMLALAAELKARTVPGFLMVADVARELHTRASVPPTRPPP